MEAPLKAILNQNVNETKQIEGGGYQKLVTTIINELLVDPFSEVLVVVGVNTSRDTEGVTKMLSHLSSNFEENGLVEYTNSST